MNAFSLATIRREAEEILAHLPVLPPPGPDLFAKPLPAWIDHTLLKPEAMPAQIDGLCEEALHYSFAAVCVNPIFTGQAARLLQGSSVRVCTVVGFPLGATPTRVKVAETRACLEMGATEIDMVLPVGLLRAEEYGAVLDDIESVCAAAHGQKALLKVIFENALLDDLAKVIACLLCKEASADFVKTSTGFGPGGATQTDVELMRCVVGPQMGVKAAGGVRSLQDARAFLASGATRLGSSSGVKIMQELKLEGK